MGFHRPASSSDGGGSGGGGNVNVIAVPYVGSGGAGTFTSTGQIPAGAIVTNVSNVVTSPFDGTTPQVSVGVSGTPSKFLGGSTTDLLNTAYPQENPQVTEQSSAAAVLVTLTGTGITTGAGVIYLTYATTTA